MRQSVIVASVSGITLAVVGYGAYQIFQAQGEIATEAEEDLNRTYAPPEILEVEEGPDGINVSGQAEFGSIVTVSVNGERERSLSVGEDGEWSIDYAVQPSEAIEMTVESFVEETPVAGDQTVLRVPAPGAEDGIAQRPLILVTSPGGPSRVVQTPFGEPLQQTPLELTIIEYDSGGGTVFAGRGQPGGLVNMARPSGAFGTVPVGPDGRWFSVVVEPNPSAFRDYTISDGAERTLNAAFQPLRDDQTLEQGAGLWQVRRDLEGGGSQVAVVFATPVSGEPAIGDELEEG